MSLLWSLFAVIALTAGYELVRELSRRYEEKSQGELALPREFLLSFAVFPSRASRARITVARKLPSRSSFESLNP